MKHSAVGLWMFFAWRTAVYAQLTVPQLGVAHFADGSVHIIHGLQANLIVEARAIGMADAASFSDSLGLTATSGLIRLVRADGAVVGEYSSNETKPLLNIDAGGPSSAAVWLPSKHLLLRWDGSRFVETSIDDSAFGGRVTFVTLAARSTAHFYIEQPDSSVARVAVALPSGRIVSSDAEPAARGWVFVQQGSLLWQDEWGLVAEGNDGSRQTIQLSRQPLPADDLKVERMADRWLHVSSRSTSLGWAVFSTASKLSVSFLPPPPVTEASR